MGWDRDIEKNSYPAWPAQEPADGFSEIRFHIDKALVAMDSSGGSMGCFELIQVEIKLKEAMGWMDQIK